jgi:hypothetical protein
VTESKKKKFPASVKSRFGNIAREQREDFKEFI